MKIENLEEFIHIAESGSFSKAADELFVSQSSLSKHILSLEKELGVELFDRSKKAIELTPIGQEILNDFKKIIVQKKLIHDKVHEYHTSKRMNVTIASIPVMAQYNITGVLTLFKVKYPNSILTIREHEGCDITHLLETKECDLAFQRNYIPDGLMEYLPFSEDCLSVVLPEIHPLSTLASINLSEIHDEQFMFLDQGTMLYQLSEDACKKAGFVPQVTYYGRRPENIIELVKNGMGVGLLMKRQAMYNKVEGIKVIPIEPKTKSTIYLTRLKDSTHHYCSNLFWNFVKDINVKIFDTNL